MATHADDGITFDRLTDDVDAVIGLAAEAWYLPDGCSDLASATFGDVELTDEERDRIARLTTGDDQRIDVTVGEGAALQVTTQAFEKVHRMEGERSARRVTRLAVGSGGYLDYTPRPQIRFAGSAFVATTVVDLADATARLAYEEVLSCGHVARGERIQYRSYRNHVLVRVPGAPVYLDNTLYEPQGSCAPELAPMDMEGMGALRGVHAPR